MKSDEAIHYIQHFFLGGLQNAQEYEQFCENMDATMDKLQEKDPAADNINPLVCDYIFDELRLTEALLQDSLHKGFFAEIKNVVEQAYNNVIKNRKTSPSPLLANSLLARSMAQLALEQETEKSALRPPKP